MSLRTFCLVVIIASAAVKWLVIPTQQRVRTSPLSLHHGAAVRHEIYFGQSIQNTHCELLRSTFSKPTATEAHSKSNIEETPVPSSRTTINNVKGIPEIQQSSPTTAAGVDARQLPALDVGLSSLSPKMCYKRTLAPAEFSAFLEQEVIPRFPKGFTVLNGQGYYAGTSSHTTPVSQSTTSDSFNWLPIQEDCKVLVILELGSPGPPQVPLTTEKTQAKENDVDVQSATPPPQQQQGDEQQQQRAAALEKYSSVPGDMECLFPPSDPSASATTTNTNSCTVQHLVDIIGLYKHYFQQDSVLWVKYPAVEAGFL